MNCLGKSRHALVAGICALFLAWDLCLSGIYALFGMCACLGGGSWLLLVDKTKIEPLSGTGGGELVRQAASTISHCLVPGLGMFCLPENELDLRYSIHDTLSVNR